MCTLVHATAHHPGAIAIIQLIGECVPVLEKLTGHSGWSVNNLRLTDIGGIDTGLVGRISENIAQIMPHGGIRVVQRITARLLELGVKTDSIDRVEEFPEAADQFEAMMLQALSRAHSPLAINLLLDQPHRWRTAACGLAPTDADVARSKRLNRLIDPPTVVLAGRPNVGKSTLSNLLLGRSMSIALDMPGTTRDYTTGQIELAGIVVNWYDTPGLRETDDPIEAKSIDIAHRLIDRADFFIAMRDHETDWPDLPRQADLYVINKVDLLKVKAKSPIDPIEISARDGQGIQSFVTALRDSLIPSEDRTHARPWYFDHRLTLHSTDHNPIAL